MSHHVVSLHIGNARIFSPLSLETWLDFWCYFFPSPSWWTYSRYTPFMIPTTIVDECPCTSSTHHLCVENTSALPTLGHYNLFGFGLNMTRLVNDPHLTHHINQLFHWNLYYASLVHALAPSYITKFYLETMLLTVLVHHTWNIFVDCPLQIFGH